MIHFIFVMFYISGLKRLKKPSLDLNTTITTPGLSSVDRVAALPGGEAVVYNYIDNNKTRQVLRLDSQGKIKNNIYSCVGCNYIEGLLVLGDYLYIIHHNGRVIKTQFSNGGVLNVTTIPDVGWIYHTGSLYSNPDRIPDKQTLLLCDLNKHEVFTFKPSTRQKKVRITGLRYPRSVSYLIYNNTMYYIVCEYGNHRITVYNNTWDRIRSIGKWGFNDGELNNPQSAIVSDEDTIIISDYGNHRISEFSFNGTFLHHLLVRSDGIYRPWSMSYYYPHLWITHGSYPHYKLYRYNLYG